jgi:hypothetical protein
MTDPRRTIQRAWLANGLNGMGRCGRGTAVVVGTRDGAARLRCWHNAVPRVPDDALRTLAARERGGAPQCRHSKTCTLQDIGSPRSVDAPEGRTGFANPLATG